MGDFAYFGPIIPFTFVVYFFVVLTFGLCYNCCCCRGNKPFSNSFVAFFQGKPFQYTYRSSTICGTYLLLLWRIACFCFFFGITFLWNYSISPNSAIYFTLWNINLFSLFYFLAMICSFIGVTYDEQFIASSGKFWSDHLVRFGWAVQILFVITGGTAFFVTVIDFVALDHSKCSLIRCL